MIYSNLIYFLVVILILSTNTPADHPQLSALVDLGLFAAKGLIYLGFLRRIFRREAVGKATAYTAAERQGSILAIVCFSLDVYLLDCQYYVNLLPGAKALPALGDLGCLALFAAYLFAMWRQAGERYREIFASRQGANAFAWGNLKINLPIVLPWLCLSLFADLLQRSPLPLVKRLMNSAWGEQAVFIAFFLCLAVLFPALVTRMWGCTPLPPGPARRRIEEFCRRHRVGYAQIMLWPLHEGQALTAGVMGIISRFRYLLVTPALLETMSPEEVEAVMAHELGHVKRHHLQIFLVMFLGFGLLAQLSSYPILYLLTSSDLFYKLIHLANRGPNNALALATTAPLFVLMIVYFRYVMGFFMRNFERQADLFALQAMGENGPLIRVFEKIAWLSGDIRDLPSWHHFGLGQRIDCLKRCANDPQMIARHDRKLRGSLVLYGVVLAITALTLWRMPEDLREGPAREKYAEAVIRQKIGEAPGNYLWRQLLGDLEYSRRHYREAAAAYRQALELSPEQPEILNNLAWLLLTVDDPGLADPAAALTLARKAVAIEPSGHILDTLGLAYWENGSREQAVLAEQRAAHQDPANQRYYQIQMQKFLTSPPGYQAPPP
ncbi:MAG: M48 family metalloprotease [Desulfobacteraceae bacterium]|nr:M48 family metalloprotease [Desulfobacteraceae bacterium]